MKAKTMHIPSKVKSPLCPSISVIVIPVVIIFPPKYKIENLFKRIRTGVLHSKRVAQGFEQGEKFQVKCAVNKFAPHHTSRLQTSER